MKIKLLASNPPAGGKILAFRVEQDGDVVEVYANDILLGWFDVKGEDGKVQFGTAYISDTAKEFINTTKKGQLTTY